MHKRLLCVLDTKIRSAPIMERAWHGSVIIALEFSLTELQFFERWIHRINRYLVVDKTNHKIHWVVILNNPCQMHQILLEWLGLKLEILQGCMFFSLPPRNLAAVGLGKATFRKLKS